ncbi:MAG: cyanophycinase [Armatimonadetes bacterium]|nr:cyanophycinase [Armatimonadota bacterium]
MIASLVAGLAFASVGMQHQEIEPDIETQSGRLFLMGGGDTTPDVVVAFIGACGGGDAPIVVLSQMREEPWRGAGSVELLAENGARNVTLVSYVDITENERALTEKILEGAAGIWLPGGDQEMFMNRWKASWLKPLFGRLVRKGVNFFGTSAGAMMMSDPMIYGPGGEPDTVQIGEGIGLVPFLVDTHFVERNRMARLQNGIQQISAKKALGLDAGEWVMVRDGKIIQAKGNPWTYGM